MAEPNPKAFIPIQFHQEAHSTVPSHNAALYRFFNPDEDPLARRITLGDAFSEEPVELEAGERAFASFGWFMFRVDDCEDQSVRQVVDFESPACFVPDPFESGDFETALAAIAALPEECLAPAAEDPCAAFEEEMRYDFGTSQAETRSILKNEILQSFRLDGVLFAPDRAPIQTFEVILSGIPEIDPVVVCSEELHNAPVSAYFFYGYQIPAISGDCFSKRAGLLLPPLSPGEHELEFLSSIGEEVLEFPTVTIIQH